MSDIGRVTPNELDSIKAVDGMAKLLVQDRDGKMKTVYKKDFDGTVMLAVENEQTARIASDTTLQENINTETAARASADTLLQQNIDTLEDAVSQGTLAAGKAVNDTNDERIDQTYYRKDGGVISGNVTIGGENDNKNLTVFGNQTLSGNLSISGNIYQQGASYETHAEQLYTTKDRIKLRDGAETGLPTGESAGLEVLKYDGENNLYLDVDRAGWASVGELGTRTVQYSFITKGLYKSNGVYYDNSACTKQHDFALPTNAADITYSDVISGGKIDVTVSYTLTENKKQHLCTVENNPQNSLLCYDGNSKQARGIPIPINTTQPLVPVLKDGHIFWGQYTGKGGTGSGTVFYGTKAQLNERLALPEDDDNYLPEGSLIILTDADEEYLQGELIIEEENNGN